MWLINEEGGSQVRSAYARADKADLPLQALGEPASALDGSVYQVAGGTAEVRVEGVLTARDNPILRFFGVAHTSYGAIREALGKAAADPAVKRVELFIDSPGGQVDGLFDTFAALEAFEKPLRVRAATATSGAYGLAAVAGRVEAVSPAATFGSIGVVQSFVVSDRIVDVTSTEAPDKRPDPATPEGQAVIRRYLDAVHELFADAIARGRGTDVKTVNETYGRGALVLASEAKRLGMIDGIAKPQLKAVGNSKARAAQGAAPEAKEKSMTLEELKAQHPGLCAQLRAEGVTAERQRVSAHLTLGRSSGDVETAYKAIEDGSEMTVDLQAKYLAAGMNRATVAATQADSDEAEAAVRGTKPRGERTAIDFAADALFGEETDGGAVRTPDGDLIL